MYLRTSCKKCRKIMISSETMTVRTCEVRGAQLRLIILECPRCKHEHVVQIDTDKTLRLLKKQVELAAAAKYCTDSKKLNAELALVASNLDKARERLIAEYDRSFYTFNDGTKQINVYKMDVTVQESEEQYE